MKRHLQCAEQQVSRSNLTKYCACHAERLAYLVLITYETSFTVRGAPGATIQPHQIPRLSRRKTHILSRHHIWNVIYSARAEQQVSQSILRLSRFFFSCIAGRERDFFFLHCRTSARHGRSTTGIKRRIDEISPWATHTKKQKATKTQTQTKTPPTKTAREISKTRWNEVKQRAPLSPSKVLFHHVVTSTSSNT